MTTKLHRDTARIAEMTDTMLAALFLALEADIQVAEQAGKTEWVGTLQATLEAIRPMRDAIADVTVR